MWNKTLIVVCGKSGVEAFFVFFLLAGIITVGASLLGIDDG
jgi:hypothetical protein